MLSSARELFVGRGGNCHDMFPLCLQAYYSSDFSHSVWWTGAFVQRKKSMLTLRKKFHSDHKSILMYQMGLYRKCVFILVYENYYYELKQRTNSNCHVIPCYVVDLTFWVFFYDEIVDSILFQLLG